MAKGCSSNNYEEARKQRLEENKKRFEDLGISKISKFLTKVTSPAKKSLNRLPRLKLKTNDEVEPRRSSRPRNQVTSYTEEFSTDLPDRRSYLRKRSRSSSSSWGSYIARPLDEIKEATQQERNRALDAAEAIQITLESSKPSFIKSMVRSHVYSCFWLGLPSRFCEEHLPKTVYNMTLEDEDGSEYDAVYIGTRSGLSGGWRAFALEHKLDDGDALVFELVEPARFKIYIVRAFPNIDEEEEEENDTLVEEENMNTSKATKVSKATSIRGSKSKKAKKQKHVIETKESESSEDSVPEININKEFKPPNRKTRSSRIEVQKKPKSPTTPDSESSEEAKMQTLKKTNYPQKKMQKTSEVPTTPEPKEEAQIETVKRKTRSSLKKMQEISEVPTTPEPKGEAQIEIVKTKTRSSQKQMQKISEVSTALESKEEAQVESVKPKVAAKLSNKTQKSKEGNDCEIDESINTEQLLPKDNVVETVDANMSEKKERVQVNDLEAVKDKPDEKPSKRASQVPRKKSAPKFFRKRT
ncbi:AP2/B3 transcriptional factor family protein [Trifolium repens]|nr:AP2/B3 transcriptional factor family protein [Trifolium repens]